jgi:hypothetical protein
VINLKLASRYLESYMSNQLDVLEDEVIQRVLLESPKLNCSLMRNNSGAFTDSTGRSVRYGLGNTSCRINENFKSSDLVGITEVRVTMDMVGKIVGVFTAIECKRGNWKFKGTEKRESAQHNFINFIKSKGGIAGFVNNVESFKDIIQS